MGFNIDDLQIEVVRNTPPNYGVDVRIVHNPTDIAVLRRGTKEEAVLNECIQCLINVVEADQVILEPGMTIDYTGCAFKE